MSHENAWQSVKFWWNKQNWIAHRIYLIVATLVAAWIVSGIVLGSTWNLIKSEHEDELLIGIFSAWMGELLFFSLVGGVVSIVTLRDPAQETVEERFRILFGRSKVPDAVAVYSKKTLLGLSCYVQRATRTIALEAYDPHRDAYLARTRMEYIYRTFLPGEKHPHTAKLNIAPDIFDGHTGELGRVLSISVSGKEVLKEFVEIQKDGFQTELNLELDDSGRDTVRWEYYLWMKVGLPHKMRTSRLIEQFDCSLVNQTNLSPRIEIDGDPRKAVSLLFNQPIPFPTVQGISPGERIFEFKLLPPVSSAMPASSS